MVPGCWAGSAVSAALLDTAAVDATTDPPSWAGRVAAAAWLAVEEVSAAAFILKCNCLKFRFGSAKVLVPSSQNRSGFAQFILASDFMRPTLLPAPQPDGASDTLGMCWRGRLAAVNPLS